MELGFAFVNVCHSILLLASYSCGMIWNLGNAVRICVKDDCSVFRMLGVMYDITRKIIVSTLGKKKGGDEVYRSF